MPRNRFNAPTSARRPLAGEFVCRTGGSRLDRQGFRSPHRRWIAGVASLAVLAAAPIVAAGSTPLATSVTASAPVAGQPVRITWAITNPTSKTVSGTVGWSANGAALHAGGALNTSSVAAGKSISGTFTVLPVPGMNTAGVDMINTSNVAVAGTGKTKPPSMITTDSPPTAPTPGATHNVPVATVVAQGNVTFDASPHSSAIPSILTDAQRLRLMKDYAPLLLYSYDHDSDEKFAPIDVIAYTQGASLAGLASPPDISANPMALLDPTGTDATGTISASQLALPVPLYVQPTQAARYGDWPSVVASQAAGRDVGLYARAFLVDANALLDDADPTLANRLHDRYGCTASPCAQVVKIEYWQFFGYSHDFDGSGLGKVGDLVQSYTDHDGDWCTVQLYVDASWWLSDRPDRAILAVYHYLHGKQASFDLSVAPGAPASIQVPTRASRDTGPVFPALEFGGPNHRETPYFSIKKDGVWLPPGGPDEKVQESHARNNVLQLAAGTASASIADFRHPVAYVEWGGHEFWPTPKWSIFGASKHNGTGRYAYFADAPVDLGNDTVSPDPNAPNDVNLVRFFAGYWGTHGGSGPPQGPSLHKEWYWNLGTGCNFLLRDPSERVECRNEALLLKEIRTVPDRPF